MPEMSDSEHRFENLGQETARAAWALWTSLWPTDSSLRPLRSRRMSSQHGVPQEIQVPQVLTAKDVKVGDLVIYFDGQDTGYSSNDIGPWMTVREVATGYSARLGRVLSKTEKTFKVQVLVRPGHNWAVNPLTLDVKRVQPEVISMRGRTRSREIGVLGNADEVFARIQAHEGFAEWQRLFDETTEVHHEYFRKMGEIRQAKEAADKPLKDAVALVNKLVGEELVRFGWANQGPVVSDDWLAQKGRLGVYVAGLAATGRITAQDESTIIGALARLKLL